MTNNNINTKATRENAELRDGGRMIDNPEFLERLESGVVTDDERREFANELMTDDDAREIYLDMCELGLFDDEEEDEEESEVESQKVANVARVESTNAVKKSFLSRATPLIASAAVLMIVAGVYFSPAPEDFYHTTGIPEDVATPNHGARSLSSPPQGTSERPEFGSLNLSRFDFNLNGSYSLKSSGNLAGFSKGILANSEPVEDSMREETPKVDLEDTGSELMKRVVAELENNKPSAAQNAYESLPEEERSNGYGKLLLGLINFEHGNYVEAEKSFQDAEESFEDGTTPDYDAKFNKAIAIIAQGDQERFKEAKDILTNLPEEYRQGLSENVQRQLEDLDVAITPPTDL